MITTAEIKLVKCNHTFVKTSGVQVTFCHSVELHASVKELVPVYNGASNTCSLRQCVWLQVKFISGKVQ